MKKTFGYVFIFLGVILIVGTIGRSDWQDFTPSVRPEEVLPFWRLLLQIGVGLGVLAIGTRLIPKSIK